MISRYITAGNKVDIRVKVKNPDYVIGSAHPTHIDLQLDSAIYDLVDEEHIYLYMPTEKGRIRMLHIGCRMELIIYNNGSIYHCDAAVEERFRQKNILLMRVVVKSPLAKHQRRDYYRIPCLIEAKVYPLAKEIYEKYATPSEMLSALVRHGDLKSEKMMIVDISGGGCKSRTDHLVEEDYVLIEIRFKDDKGEVKMHIPMRVIDSYEHDKKEVKKYDTRYCFEKITKTEREKIIKYIFEKERYSRNKEKR
jgi:c-di-GMP-binding flagellar brake protein YcgR